MKKIATFLFLITLVAMSACSDDNKVTLPDITVNFGSATLGMDAGDQSEEIAVTLSRAASANVNVTIAISGNGVTYGTQFTTDPAAMANTLTVQIPAGETSQSFTVHKTAGILLEGDESVNFSITAISPVDGFQLGERTECVLSFSTIISEGGQMTIQGHNDDGTAYGNSVYIDLSANKQYPVDRKSWNLGFYSGSGYYVVLNGSYATAATPSGKTDINAVTLADAEAALNIAGNGMMVPLDASAVDTGDGALEGTVFGEIAANSDQNQVFFVASEDNKDSRSDWYKVKIDRSGSGYLITWGIVGETTIHTYEVPKSTDYNLTFFSLEGTGSVVAAEPQADKWDIQWTYGTGFTMGSPYFMQDLILINNLAGVEAVQVMTNQVTYEAFNASHLNQYTPENRRNVIASNWRYVQGGMTGGSSYVHSDRFYVVKDPAGNYYKLRFTALGFDDGTVRGMPIFEYALVQ